MNKLKQIETLKQQAKIYRDIADVVEQVTTLIEEEYDGDEIDELMGKYMTLLFKLQKTGEQIK